MSKNSLGNLSTYRLTEQKILGRSFQGWSSHVTISSKPRGFFFYLFHHQYFAFLPHACCLMITRWLPLFRDYVLTPLFEGRAQRSIPHRDFLFTSLLLERKKYFSTRLQQAFLYVSLISQLGPLRHCLLQRSLRKQVRGCPTSVTGSGQGLGMALEWAAKSSCHRDK